MRLADSTFFANLAAISAIEFAQDRFAASEGVADLSVSYRVFGKIFTQSCINACLPTCARRAELRNHIARQANGYSFLCDFRFGSAHAKQWFDLFPLFICVGHAIRI
jgi:hypothetical protein